MRRNYCRKGPQKPQKTVVVSSLWLDSFRPSAFVGLRRDQQGERYTGTALKIFVFFVFFVVILFQ
jgi:hypothetical protein